MKLKIENQITHTWMCLIEGTALRENIVLPPELNTERSRGENYTFWQIISFDIFREVHLNCKLKAGMGRENDN